MSKFTISAPGRIVLCGEHSATYGKHFVVTSLNLRTKLQFWQLSDESQIIKIEFSKIHLRYDIPLEEVRSFLSQPADVKSNPIRVFDYVKSLITFNGMWYTLRQRYSLKIFFFLLYKIACDGNLDIKPFRVRVSTDLPIDAGLGSSTSFAVCLAACFLHWKHLQRGDQIIEFNNEFLENVQRYVELYEEFMHNVHECATADVRVCVYGNILISQLTDININMASRDMIEMKILLIDSKIRQRKFYQAKQMAKLKLDFRNSSEFNTVLNRLDNLAITMYNCLNSISNNIENPNLVVHLHYYISLQRCIRRTQLLLEKYNLSDNAFNHIFTTANNIGFPGKLTGFAPGYVYIVLPPSITEEAITNIKNYLEEGNHLIVTPTSINCEGLIIDN